MAIYILASECHSFPENNKGIVLLAQDRLDILRIKQYVLIQNAFI